MIDLQSQLVDVSCQIVDIRFKQLQRKLALGSAVSEEEKDEAAVVHLTALKNAIEVKLRIVV